MAKPKRRYVCQACGSVTFRWQGQCADCGEWNTLSEEAPETVFSAKHDLFGGGRKIAFEPLDKPGEKLVRRSTGIAEFDRALGGGLVPGSAVLMGGDPGIGKSTLLIQAAAQMARAGGEVVYISGEEAAGQVRLRAERLGLADAPIRLAAATSVRDILTTLGGMAPPALVVIDSIQTMHSDQIEGAPGTVSQVRASAFELIRFAKECGCALVLVGHVTKDGSIAGPRVLEHMVDVVMSFEGERSHQYRILRNLKNRFGPVDEIGVFAMAGAGLEEVGNPSMLFLSGRENPVPGSAVFPAMEGTRPVLVEIQALIVRLASGATPQRASSTASSMASRPLSHPTTARRGVAPLASRTISAWISTRTGRVPSIAGKTALPGTGFSRPERNSIEGLPTSSRPAPAMAKTPISSTGPKRFLRLRRIRYWWLRSPSKLITTSTICSSTRGPAIEPSLVTWPTSTSA
ncbi:MAG: DNA repair protein RadA, partial [Novosphingobium sp.]